MSGFDAAWLDAREPVDHAARSRRLARAFADAVGPSPRIVDLGTGSGSNLRYLAPLLPGRQRWMLVDHDPLLLAAASSRLERWADANGLAIAAADDGLRITGEGREILVDFHEEDIAAKGWSADGEVTGITAAALLDLTSAAWLDAFAEQVARCPRPLLFALSFDGRLQFDPVLDEDEAVRRCFVRHQGGDKGFGPALGPDAAGHLAGRLQALGRPVELEAADWRLGDDEQGLARMFLAGIQQVLLDLGAPPALASWMARRREQLAMRRLRISVGHQDLFAG